MSKKEAIDLLMLISALESWSFSASTRMPDYLYERIADAVEVLTREVLACP